MTPFLKCYFISLPCCNNIIKLSFYGHCLLGSIPCIWELSRHRAQEAEVSLSTGQQTETGTLKSSVLVSADNAFLRGMFLNLSAWFEWITIITFLPSPFTLFYKNTHQPNKQTKKTPYWYEMILPTLELLGGGRGILTHGC